MQWNFRLLWKDLIDIFKCKIKRVINRVIYPYAILPKPGYIFPIDINKLNTIDSYVIIRRSDKTAEETFNEYGLLREDIIFDNRIPGMSMNLLGGFFEVDHIRFVPKGPASEYWDSVSKIELKKYLDHIDILKTYSPIFFLIRDLQNIKFPYSRPNDSNARKLLTAFNQKPSSDGSYNLSAKLEIRHKPSNLNYWHVELTIIELDSGESPSITSTSSAWKKALVHSVYHHLSAKALSKHPPIPIVAEGDYCKNAS